MNTWRRKSGLARWVLRHPASEGRAQERLPEVLNGVVLALSGFAVAVQASWSTAQAEDAFMQILRDNPTETLKKTQLSEPPIEVVLELDLAVDLGGEETLIERGGHLQLEPEPEGVVVVLNLEVDLYAPESWGKERNNQALAKLNGPRLSGFLSRLVEQGMVFEEVDAPDYPGQVSERGFHSAHAS